MILNWHMIYFWSYFSNSVTSWWLLKLQLSICIILLFWALWKHFWVQELRISNVNFSNIFIYAHKRQAWKSVMWCTFRSTFHLCENTWWGAGLNQCKTFLSLLSKLYV
jgi:hypothetical protein